MSPPPRLGGIELQTAELQAQLIAIAEDFEAAQRRLDRLVAGLPQEKWATRADPERWSVAECIAHLNLTSKAFIPIIREALEACRSMPARASPTRYHLDFAGWLIWRASGPGVGFMRMKTTAPFVPQGELPRDTVLAEFARLQQDQIRCVSEADGLPIDKVRVRSPFNTRLRYSVYSALSILPRHQHRHLNQAERVWTSS
jgi:hypothetical protein